jgi:glutathione peroxidase
MTTALRIAALFVLSTVAMFAANSVHDFTLDSIDGEAVSLADYKGKVLLMVNVASRCGFTPQYKGLEALYRKYKDDGLVVMGFPANNFGAQEPGTNKEIKAFCSRKFDVSFPMFGKISVKGDDKAPLYQYLTDEQSHPKTGGDVQWNFTKFLADGDGNVIARFAPDVTPESQQMASAIEAALK